MWNGHDLYSHALTLKARIEQKSLMAATQDQCVRYKKYRI
jgi:hypothetical protein